MATSKANKTDQPYSNMQARKGVLIAGLTLSSISFIIVFLGSLFLFVPSTNFFSPASPSIMLVGFFASGIATAFVGTVFAVAGANTEKSVARLSMFLSTVAFITGAAMLTIVLFFRTILPIDAIERLGQAASMLVF